MDDFFKFDEKRIVFILWLSISILLCCLAVLVLKVVIAFIPVLLCLIITIVATIFSFNEGIHFNYKKGKIVIVEGRNIYTLDMKDVKYFQIKELEREKKSITIQPFADPFKLVNSPSKYVYNNGKVFDIEFYTKTGVCKIYYGWLYRTKSTKRIEQQLARFQQIQERFQEYKKS